LRQIFLPDPAIFADLGKRIADSGNIFAAPGRHACRKPAGTGDGFAERGNAAGDHGGRRVRWRTLGCALQLGP
jgi:hypothetical protein